MENYIIPIIMAICFILGEIIKKWIKDVDNKYIPTINAVVGVVLSCWLSGWAVSPAIILAGLASGWAATGGYEAVTKLLKDKVTE